MTTRTLARQYEPDRARQGVTSWDPSVVFLVKVLLYPAVATGTLGLALWLHGTAFVPQYFLVTVLAFFATSEVLDTAPLQSSGPRSMWPTGLIVIALQWFIVMVFVHTLITLSGLAKYYDRRVLATWAVITPFALWSTRLTAQFAFQWIGARSLPARNAVIIGRNDLGVLLERRLQDASSLRVRLLGFFDDRQSAGDGAMILGEPADLPQYILAHEVHVVFITWPMARESRILDLLETLRDSTVSIYFVPDLSVATLVQGRLDLINGVPMVGVCESPFLGIPGLAKRLCDIIFACAAIVLAAPLLAIAAIGVRLSGAGPVIFKQFRYGLNGELIVVYKFRSMTVTEDGDLTFTHVIRNDGRLTPFGAFIRRTSIDELPQLFNVLEGTMSLVGPRPHAVAMNERYRKLIPGYMVRHKVKPGITGWAQVNGLRGGDDLESMRLRIEFDLEYLRYWSLGLDLAILLRTITLVWTDRKAY